jgi:glucose/arabinose dehydrogenase
MRRRNILDKVALVIGIVLITGPFASLSHAEELQAKLANIKLPAGFEISLFAEGIDSARSLALGSKGTVFVGTRGDKVYALRDGKVTIIAKGLNAPNGVAFKDGSLYVAEINRVLRFDKIEEQLANPPRPVVINESYPKDSHHGFKFIAFGPDGKLYIPVGAPCNVCEKKDPRYASITRMKADGSAVEVIASGVRNTVGFDWHPVTKDLWFTDNGRDWMGDNSPPDELNRLGKVGAHFGFPYCHGGDTPDPDLGKGRKCSDFTPPELKLGPHVASLGMRFYSGGQFPEEYRNSVLIAEHGSWNRSQPLGYRISLAKFVGGKKPEYETFASGWLQGNQAWGRPVDVLVQPDGSVLVSDDQAGAVYKISYRKPLLGRR